MTVKYEVKNLRLSNTLKQISELRRIQDKHIILDFGKVNVVRNAGMQLFIACIEDMRIKGYTFYYNKEAQYFYDPEKHAINYAKGVGFFKALGFSGIKGGNYIGSDSYVPIQRIDYGTLFENVRDYHDGIVRYSDKLATVLVKDIPELKSILSYMIREIMRNTFEHTGKLRPHIWVGAQRHMYEGNIEVALVDSNEGIRQVLTAKKEFREMVRNDEDALKLAIKPGISGNATELDKNKWGNSGYGLYVTSKLLSILGTFNLISGKCWLECKENEVSSHNDIDFQGPAVILKIDLNRAYKITNNIIEQIVKEGEQEAEGDPLAIISASKASKLVKF